MTSKVVIDQIYNIKYEIVVGTFDELRRTFSAASREGLDKFAQSAAVTFDMLENKTIVLWFNTTTPEAMLNEIAVHETFHAITLALALIGMDVSKETQEPYAYYQTWLYRQCKYVLNKHFSTHPTTQPQIVFPPLKITVTPKRKKGVRGGRKSRNG